MRIQFEFSNDAVNELDKLREQLNAGSRGEVINYALGVLRWLVNEKHVNHNLIIVERKGKPMEVVFPQFESLVRKKASRGTER